MEEQDTLITEASQPEAFASKPHESKLDILDKVFASNTRRKIRYFLVVGDFTEEKKTIIVHIDSGAWISLENSFDEAVARIDEKPESDAPLLSAILTTRMMALENAIIKEQQRAADSSEPSCDAQASCSADASCDVDSQPE